MQRLWVFILTWFVVTGISVLIATQAVTAIRDAVTDTPATLPTIVAGDTTATTSTPPATEPSTTVRPPTTAATSTTEPPKTDPSSPPTTSAPATTTTVPATTTTTTTSPTTTSTTIAPSTTTTTTPAETTAYQLTGGWVRVRYGGAEVSLVDAAPYAGFSMDVEERGPLVVEVEFDGDDYEGTFRARMEGGVLEVDISEDDDD
jgi:hypothetical protein